MSRISKVRNNNQAPGLQGAYFKLTLLQKNHAGFRRANCYFHNLTGDGCLAHWLAADFYHYGHRPQKKHQQTNYCRLRFNLAGVFIYLFHVINNFTVRDAFFILQSDIFNLIIMLALPD